MNGDQRSIASKAAELRQAFDRSFARAADADRPPSEDLLAIRVGGDAFAVRFAEVAGVFVDCKLAPLPGSAPQLIGLTALKGRVLPVYDLGALLGYPAAAAARSWLVAAGAPVALAFDRFDGHLRVAREAVTPRRSADANQPFVDEAVRTERLIRPIIRVASVVKAIESLARRARPAE